MRPHSSIRHSKKTDDSNSNSASAYGFNRKRLAKELLSLGNPKISTPIAENISFEVEKEILKKDESLLSAETISELVRFKLEEMGLIEIKRPKEQVRKIQTEKAMKVTHPFAPQTPPLRLALKSAPMHMSKEALEWSIEGKRAFARIPEWFKISHTHSEKAEDFLDKMSRTLADIDSNFEGFHDSESTATQFFNRMACLDFIPGSLLFKTNYNNGQFESAPSSYSAKPESEKVYETISYFSKSNISQNTTLGLQFQNKPEQQNATLLLLKLLKTSLEYDSPQASHRQELYLSFQNFVQEESVRASLTDENDVEDLSSPFSSLFNWLEAEDNRKYFSLSLGVPGRTSPYLSAPESFEQNLVRILHSHLQVNSSVRLYFLERCLEALNDSQGQADRAPNPQSPGLYSQGEIVPSLFLNLAVMVKDEEVDWDRLRRASRQAVHFLDNVIDFWVYPNPEVEKITKSNRSISIGVMGLSDLLFTLRIPYNSQEGLDLAGKIAAFIEEESQKASIELAKTRGVFPNYIGSSWQEKGIALRNAHICSIAWDPLPALIAQTSTGIEPYPALVELEGFDGEKPRYLIHPFLAQTARKRGFLNDRILARAIELRSLSAVQEVPDDIRKVFVSNADINLQWHLLMGAAFEKHFDSGVVKTCPLNIFSNHSDNIQSVLEQARELGLKSLWIKREGDVITPPKLIQPIVIETPEVIEEVLEAKPIEEVVEKEDIKEELFLESLILEENLLEESLPEEEEEEEEETSFDLQASDLDELTEILPADIQTESIEVEEDKTEVVTPEPLPRFIRSRERPEVLQGSTRKQSSCCGDVFITLNQDETGPYEILTQFSKTFGNEGPLLEVVSKLITLALKCGVDPQEIHEQLEGVICLKHLNSPQAEKSSPLETLAKTISELFETKTDKSKELEELFDEDKTEVIHRESLLN